VLVIDEIGAAIEVALHQLAKKLSSIIRDQSGHSSAVFLVSHRVSIAT
jgi:hypothetical protein